MVNAAYMKKESNDAIKHGNEGDYRQECTRNFAVERTPDTSNHHRRCQQHRAIHNALAITALIVFICYFKPGDKGGKSSYQRQAALEASLTDMLIKHNTFASNFSWHEPQPAGTAFMSVGCGNTWYFL